MRNRELVPRCLFRYISPMFEKCKSEKKEPVPISFLTIFGFILFLGFCLFQQHVSYVMIQNS